MICHDPHAWIPGRNYPRRAGVGKVSVVTGGNFEWGGCAADEASGILGGTGRERCKTYVLSVWC